MSKYINLGQETKDLDFLANDRVINRVDDLSLIFEEALKDRTR
ncbi:hypothetical protein [Neochlamydia sp. AcF65]|nr:hypothetical protein [Neochlamydia sp. AcF65]